MSLIFIIISIIMGIIAALIALAGLRSLPPLWPRHPRLRDLLQPVDATESLVSGMQTLNPSSRMMISTLPQQPLTPWIASLPPMTSPIPDLDTIGIATDREDLDYQLWHTVRNSLAESQAERVRSGR